MPCAEMKNVLGECLFDRSDHAEPDDLDNMIIHACSSAAGEGYVNEAEVDELATHWRTQASDTKPEGGVEQRTILACVVGLASLFTRKVQIIKPSREE